MESIWSIITFFFLLHRTAPVFCRLGEVFAGRGKLKDLAWSTGGASWLMLLVLFLHSMARRPRQALWQLTPQAARERDGGAERRWEGRGRGGRRVGSESRREGAPGLQRDRERGTGSNKGKGANRKAGVNGEATTERVELCRSLQTHEHWHAHTARESDPDSNSVNQWGAWEEKSSGPLGEIAQACERNKLGILFNGSFPFCYVPLVRTHFALPRNRNNKLIKELNIDVNNFCK